jgi:uncharacterized membrane protein
MSNELLGSFHPQVVHFAIVLGIAGVVFRLLSLTGRIPFASPAAATLLILGAAAMVVSAETGIAAHGPVERVPGARSAVEEHEEWGLRARNAFIAVGLIEIGALLLARRRKPFPLHALSGLVGLAGLFVLYEASEHGGELVYGHAGGVGIRSGDPEDVERLLLAGLYHQSQIDRKGGRHDEAARLVEEMARRFPGQVEVELLSAESQILDRKDGDAALATLAGIEVPSDSQRLNVRHGVLRADALTQAGRPEEARRVLEELLVRYPENRTLKERLSPGSDTR